MNSLTTISPQGGTKHIRRKAAPNATKQPVPRYLHNLFVLGGLRIDIGRARWLVQAHDL